MVGMGGERAAGAPRGQVKGGGGAVGCRCGVGERGTTGVKVLLVLTHADLVSGSGPANDTGGGGPPGSGYRAGVAFSPEVGACAPTLSPCPHWRSSAGGRRFFSLYFLFLMNEFPGERLIMLEEPFRSKDFLRLPATAVAIRLRTTPSFTFTFGLSSFVSTSRALSGSGIRLVPRSARTHARELQLSVRRASLCSQALQLQRVLTRGGCCCRSSRRTADLHRA